MSKMENCTVKILPISALKEDNAIQSRIENCPKTIDEYRENLIDGDGVFPPIEVFHDGHVYMVVDGIHRLRAAVGAGKSEIQCNVYIGTRNDAILYAAGANSRHGLNRTSADVEKAIEMVSALNDGVKRSERDIARIVGVHHSRVNRLLRKLSQCDSPNKTAATNRKQSKELTDRACEISDYTEADFEKDELRSALDRMKEEKQELETKVALNFFEGTDEDRSRMTALIGEKDTTIDQLQKALDSRERELVTSYRERNEAITYAKNLKAVLKRKDKELEICKVELESMRKRVKDMADELEFYKDVESGGKSKSVQHESSN